MGSDTDAEKPCLVSLQNEAFQCLDTFPGKILELNSVIDSFMPSTIRRAQRSGSTSSTIKDYDPAANLPVDNLMNYTSPKNNHDHSQRGVYKKRCRLKGHGSHSLRKKPGPLGNLITFVAGNIFKCTSSLLISPSCYIVEKFISLLSYRRQQKNALCGPTPDPNSSASAYASALEESHSAVGNFITVVRPAAVQLIADTGILKRWLQALAMTSPESPVILSKAIRVTETIDCWAYELFFTLKCFQMNLKRNSEKVATIGLKMNNDIELIRLWHRLIQLRNNYIILHETLRHDKKFHELMPSKPVEA